MTKKPAILSKSTTHKTMYDMPVEVKDWIDQASSRIKHLTSENERLKEEVKTLKTANRVMEKRVMGTSYE